MPSISNRSRLIISSILVSALTVSCSLAAIGQNEINYADRVSNEMLLSLERVVSPTRWLPSDLLAGPLTWVLTAVVQMLLLIVIVWRISFVCRLTNNCIATDELSVRKTSGSHLQNDPTADLMPPRGIERSTNLSLKPQRDMRLPSRPKA